MAVSAYLLDTNILLRISRRDDPDHRIVDAALAKLIGDGSLLHYTHQTMAEFWNVATRPAERNGFGLMPSDADRQVLVMEAGMVLLPDSEAVYHEWRRLVLAHGVCGVKVHDARLIAAMNVHGVTHLLSLNSVDFERYTNVEVIHPAASRFRT